jgi:dCMP deaminase
MTMTKAIVAYVPVIHRGYLSFLERNCDGTTRIFTVSGEMAAPFMMHEEIRAISGEEAATALSALGFANTSVLTTRSIGVVKKNYSPIALPNDEVCRRIAERYFKKKELVFDTAFLRWDEKAVAAQQPSNPDRVSENELDRAFMALAEQESTSASCWWRRVGAVAVRARKNLLADHNRHMPSENEPYFSGDPRDVVTAGTKPEIATSIHAEQAVIAYAARHGIALRGADLYVTTFPCPPCANAIAFAGFKRCFFRTGHASVAGRAVLKAFNVEVIQVR